MELRFKSLKELESNAKFLTDNLSYVYTNLNRLKELTDECKQYDYNFEDCQEVEKMVRVNRYMNKTFMNLYNLDYVFLCGLYLKVKVYIFGNHSLDKALKKCKYGAIDHPEEFGLPSNDKVNYGTLKEIAPGTYMALSKSNTEYVQELILRPLHYEFLF